MSSRVSTLAAGAASRTTITFLAASFAASGSTAVPSYR